MTTAEMSRLMELRAKTDRELLALVKTELERASLLANVAATRESPFYQDAQTILVRVVKLLPTIPGLGRSERESLDARIKEVTVALELVPAQRVHPRGLLVGI